MISVFMAIKNGFIKGFFNAFSRDFHGEGIHSVDGMNKNNGHATE